VTADPRVLAVVLPISLPSDNRPQFDTHWYVCAPVPTVTGAAGGAAGGVGSCAAAAAVSASTNADAKDVASMATWRRL
jgi:hypothetical protein